MRSATLPAIARLLAVLALAGGLTAVTATVTMAHHDPEHTGGEGQGANQPGDFTSDPEAEPAPSANGLGDGNATGRPCAGCVGNADDKNPPGQSHDPEDANAGYECDRNQGIGQTNPAHTGCDDTSIAEEPTGEEPTGEEPIDEPPTVEEPTSEEPTDEEPNGEEPTGEPPTAVGSVSEEPTDEPPTAVGSVSEGPTGEQPPAEEQATLPVAAVFELPSTGAGAAIGAAGMNAEALLLLAIAGLCAGGAAAGWRSSRREA